MVDGGAAVVRIQDAVQAVHLLQVDQPLFELQPLASPLPHLRFLNPTGLLLDFVVLRANRTKIVLVSLASVRHLVEKLTDGRLAVGSDHWIGRRW